MNSSTPPILVSDNIFADLGIPDAEEQLQKAQLARAIRAVIADSGLTQQEAARQMGTSQSKISLIVGGKLAGFGSDRLLKYLRALECDIEIKITRKPANHPQGSFKVVCDI